MAKKILGKCAGPSTCTSAPARINFSPKDWDQHRTTIENTIKYVVPGKERLATVFLESKSARGSLRSRKMSLKVARVFPNTKMLAVWHPDDETMVRQDYNAA